MLNYKFFYRLSKNRVNVSKSFNWFENQIIDKGWNLGFRNFFPNQEKNSYGYQDFNKHFNVKTYVLTDTAEKMFGFLGKKLQSMNSSRDDLVYLENPDFEKQFVVYSSDQIEARYILSPSGSVPKPEAASAEQFNPDVAQL